MSIYAQFDEDGSQEQIASNRGWSEFGDWVETLNANDFPTLAALWEHGATSDIRGLTSEVAKAVKSAPPSKDVKTIAKFLLSALRGNAKAGCVLVTNGMKA